MNKEIYLEEYPKHKNMRENVKRDKNRLHFHMMPPTGWMNDPNGLCQFHGINHIYFQYTPFLAGWGTKLWGHYTTKDWIHYEEEEPFLFPDTKWDRDGVYSGSAIVKEDGIHFFYTGNVKLYDKEYDYIMNGREQNTMHLFSPDGKNIIYKEMVMTNDDYPSNMSKHVRDPKVYEKDGTYYMIQGGRDEKDRGCALLFQSADLKNWKWYDTIYPEKTFGYMWECPDLFEIDGQQIMTCCPQGVEQKGYDYQNVYQCGYFPVNFDLVNKKYEFGTFVEFDKGFEKYDVILTPTSPTVAFGIGEKSDNPLEMYLADICTVSVNIAGLPGISIPCGVDSNGLPIGMQLIGNKFQEETILNAAYSFEQEYKFREKYEPEFKKGGVI